ncbi:hypothetical protein GCM10022225_73930 [Plantactinospora mayteni]|uniref:Uncharacterized protein n=1 Tax=Plantactinospora mayteni TaxID=566021 RepID=A0ABQ4EWD3_9ACTN|nr:hypothetical protein Pma05_55220 [Plantactinospora mayteni]
MAILRRKVPAGLAAVAGRSGGDAGYWAAGRDPVGRRYCTYRCQTANSSSASSVLPSVVLRSPTIADVSSSQ